MMTPNIAWLIPELDLKNPSVRIRRYNVHQKLQSMGIISMIRSNYYSVSLHELIGELMPYNVIIFTQIAQMDSTLMSVLKNLGKKVIFDHCEALFHLPFEDACMKTANNIICCSTRLAELTNENGYPNTIILKDPIEDRTIDHKYEVTGRRLKAGFMGMGGNSHNIDSLRAIIEKADYDLITVTEWENASIKWTLDDWHLSLNTCDVALCPQIFPAKSNVKVTQALAFGLPVIASSIQAYQEVIRQGVNGYLCHNPEDWEGALMTLKDENKRRSVGEEAKKSVGDYTLDTIARQWLEMFKSL
jgi:glycosyltransferase involved in cell wall biosynthesis